MLLPKYPNPTHFEWFIPRSLPVYFVDLKYATFLCRIAAHQTKTPISSPLLNHLALITYPKYPIWIIALPLSREIRALRRFVQIHFYDITAITETWLTECIPTIQIFLIGRNPFLTHGTNRRENGCMVYVDYLLASKLLSAKHSNFLHSCSWSTYHLDFISIQTNLGNRVLRPQSSTLVFWLPFSLLYTRTLYLKSAHLAIPILFYTF